jgi:hypothetical protein
MLRIVASGEREDPPSEAAQAQPSCRYDGRVQAVVCLAEKQEAKMNWVKCTDMHNRPIYVNIEMRLAFSGTK